jgi:hypothetical protein
MHSTFKKNLIKAAPKSARPSATGVTTDSEIHSGYLEPHALNAIDEEDAFDGASVRRVPHRGVYLLPNSFTLAALFSGFYAIVQAMNGRFEYAAIAIFCSMVLLLA